MAGWIVDVKRSFFYRADLLHTRISIDFDCVSLLERWRGEIGEELGEKVFNY
ncbi:hypothetical protein HanIR_Chr08g0344241 [Helianthus annuus]|nr:hypothetical protein HanIR_Chr08g0344241 [Helianthus annuus]